MDIDFIALFFPIVICVGQLILQRTFLKSLKNGISHYLDFTDYW